MPTPLAIALASMVGPTGALVFLCGAAVPHVALVLPLLPIALRMRPRVGP